MRALNSLACRLLALMGLMTRARLLFRCWTILKWVVGRRLNMAMTKLRWRATRRRVEAP